MEKLLPFWIIGAPLVLAILNWFSTPKGSGDKSLYESSGGAGDMSALPGR